jgi:hypothetical protein
MLRKKSFYHQVLSWAYGNNLATNKGFATTVTIKMGTAKKIPTPEFVKS